MQEGLGEGGLRGHREKGAPAPVPSERRRAPQEDRGFCALLFRQAGEHSVDLRGPSAPDFAAQYQEASPFTCHKFRIAMLVLLAGPIDGYPVMISRPRPWVAIGMEGRRHARVPADRHPVE